MTAVLKPLLIRERLHGLLKLGNAPGRTVHTGETHPAPPRKASKATRPLVLPYNIPISQSFVKGHPLEDIILKKTPLSICDLSKAIDFANFHLSMHDKTGAIPASTNKRSTYSSFGWVRDMANKANALYEIGKETGDLEEPLKNVRALATFFNRREERGRFTNFHWDPNAWEKYIRTSDGDLPQIRALIDDNGNLTEHNQGWKHNQLDAIGAWLYFTFKMANENKLNLKDLNDYLTTKVNDENKFDSIFSVALTFLNRVRYWESVDAGAWEDLPGYKRASSLGICLAAFKEAHKYFESHNWNSIEIWNETNLKTEIENGIRNGTISLKERVPEDGREAIETDTFPWQRYDSALIFLLYPFNPGLSEAQEEAILKTVYNHRMGEVGFTRRDRDNYVGQNYAYETNRDGIYANMDVENYKAAEWTLFDPLLAAYHFKKFVASNGKRVENYFLAMEHTKRSIAQIVKTKDSMERSVGNHIYAEQGDITEAFWFDTHEGRWRPNENTPLLWAEANFALMIKEAIPAIELWEKQSSLGHIA